MQLTLEWSDIALRLTLAFFAGLLFGLNRGEHGKPAGLRTMILVCLAAAIAMILGNAMITTHGKTADSFVQLDMMRLPLGILTGIGFIGAGTILKKGDLVVGVTTAASVWFVTVIGLALGAGHFGIGLAGLALGLFALWTLGALEEGIRQERTGILTVSSDPAKPNADLDPFLRQTLAGARCKVTAASISYTHNGIPILVRLEVRWRARRHENRPPDFLKQITAHPGITSVQWRS